jgi:hypothetical protein
VINKMPYVIFILEIHVIVIYRAFMPESFTAFSLLVKIILIVFAFIMNDAHTIYTYGLM